LFPLTLALSWRRPSKEVGGNLDERAAEIARHRAEAGGTGREACVMGDGDRRALTRPTA
jgi:hypothetical protein